MNKLLFGLFLLLMCCTSSDPTQDGPDQSQYVIMVSFDGFRYDYVDKYGGDNFKEMAASGAKAESVIPAFPTKTFPNHYTLITGMYPGNHGLVDNTFYDPGRDTFYSIGQRDKVQDGYYYSGLPLWQLAQQSDMKSASYFWVGSEAEVEGSYPDYYKIYDGSIPNEDRIDQVIEWLNLPKNERPNFITLYFSFLDSQGHATGPEAEATGQSVLEADRLLGVLREEISKLSLNINLIVTSDHGMYELNNDELTFIYVDDMLEGFDQSRITFVRNGTHAHVFVNDQETWEDVYHILKSRERNYTVYPKNETPADWHYRNHDRIGDFIIAAEHGYHITTRDRQESNPETREVWGNHGFDPYACPEMATIFYAEGPKIKEAIEVPTFENVHIYPLVAQILGLPIPDHIDGQIEKLEFILK